MSVHLLEPVNYLGVAGVLQLHRLQSELGSAFIAQDWARVRRLDASCHALVEKVIAANSGDLRAIRDALSELKGVYAGLIAHCQSEVAAMAH